MFIQAYKPGFDFRGKTWRLKSQLIYRALDGEYMIVPRGFPTNFASVPAIGRPFVKTWGEGYVFPSVLHDWLYSVQTYSRRKSDQYFYEAMMDDGAGKFTAYVFWLGVRLGGWIPWIKHRRKLNNGG